MIAEGSSFLARLVHQPPFAHLDIVHPGPGTQPASVSDSHLMSRYWDSQGTSCSNGTMFISLEDHFASTASLASHENIEAFKFNLWPKQLLEKLTSLGALRLQDMEDGLISLQVVSSLPIAEPRDVCKQTNDELAAAIKEAPQKLAGFAALPMADGILAAAELERTVSQHGFLGALIPNHVGGKYYDTEKHDPLWSQAERLGVPIYLHPCPPPESLIPHYQGNYGPDVAEVLSLGAWGWHSEVALHVLRLYASGVFDRHPNLQLVIGHAGEMLPYMLYRIPARLARTCRHLSRSFDIVWKENIWVTISGIWDLAAMACLVRSMSIDRIMFSVDYPFEPNTNGSRFMQELKESKLVTEDEWEMIAYRNAQRLLKLDVI